MIGHNGAVSAPIIVIVGRMSPEAKNVRGEAYASGQRYSNAIEQAGGVPLMLPPIPARSTSDSTSCSLGSTACCSTAAVM